MQDLVSIIVPIYKVEKYLANCLESIANQTYTNIQVVLVNDGSPDNCQAICESYCQKDKRFVLVNKKNGGLASARNAGMDVALGQYMACVDSDDWVEPNMIEILHKNMVENNADMSVCSFYENYGNELKKENFSRSLQILSQEDAVKRVITPGKFYGFAWNKMYKTALIGTDRYNEKIFKGEDSPFSLQYILKCNKIVVQDIPLYHYRVDSVSISRSKFNIGKMTVLDAYQGMIDNLSERGLSNEIINMQKVQYAGKLLSLRTNIILSGKDSFASQLNVIDRQMKKYESLYIRSNSIDFKHKFAYILGSRFKFLFELFCKAYKG